MHLIDKGIDWLETQRKKALIEPVIMETSAGSINIHATVIEPETTTTDAGLKVVSDKWMFLITRSLIAGIDIKRGIRFSRKGMNFEAILDGNFIKDYNDPNKTVVAISVKEVKHTPT